MKWLNKLYYEDILFAGLLPKLFRGRINRRNYVLGLLINFLFILSIIFYGFGLITYLPTPSFVRTAFTILGIILFSFFLDSLVVRRLHDLDCSWGELYRFFYSKRLGYFPTFATFYKAGNKGPNKFGNPPESKIDIKSLFGLT